MGFRFRKSFRVMPGVRLNVSKGGFSTSIGGKGLTANLSKRGVRATAGLPGTGLSYSKLLGGGRKGKAASVSADMPLPRFTARPRPDPLPDSENNAVLTAIKLVGLIAPIVLASLAAGSVLAWIGWVCVLLLFGFVMLALGRASVAAQ